MDISFINTHVAKPQFTAGKNYVGKIVAVVDKPTGFTAEFAFDELDVPDYWHFNVLHPTKKSKDIAMNNLKGLTDMVEGAVSTSADLVGKEVTVRLTAQSDSNLPALGLPMTKAPESGF